MKQRSGFVSNSSSSSFCIYGIGGNLWDDLFDFDSKFDAIKEAFANEVESSDVKIMLNNAVDKDEFISLIGKLSMSEDIYLNDALEIICYPLDPKKDGSGFYYYIGRDWFSIGDYETGLEFKDSIRIAAERYFNTETLMNHLSV